jgi:hypothetical protein
VEALLLLRANVEAIWDAASTAKRIYTSEQEAAELLGRLHADGFLHAEPGGYRFGCRSPEQQQAVDRLADLYARRLIPVTNLIHSKPRRIREFADAFRLKKEP